MSKDVPAAVETRLAPRARLAVAAARFNAAIVEELLAGCLRQLKKLGAEHDQIDVVRVPGAFELPLAAKLLARTGRYDAVICLGCVIRGDTPHFDYVAGECARGVQNVSIDESLPVIFGVLTTNTEQQARDRIGGSHGHAGERAADTAVEMIALAALLSAAAAKKKAATTEN